VLALAFVSERSRCFSGNRAASAVAHADAEHTVLECNTWEEISSRRTSRRYLMSPSLSGGSGLVENLTRRLNPPRSSVCSGSYPDIYTTFRLIARPNSTPVWGEASLPSCERS
jgi:hypothetical protein